MIPTRGDRTLTAMNCSGLSERAAGIPGLGREEAAAQGLGDEGIQRALLFRLYARTTPQSIADDVCSTERAAEARRMDREGAGA